MFLIKLDSHKMIKTTLSFEHDFSETGRNLMVQHCLDYKYTVSNKNVPTKIILYFIVMFDISMGWKIPGC